MTQQWYHSFFHGVTMEFWRQSTTPRWTKSEAAFLEDIFQLEPGGKLLDVPCGFGRHAIELARRGMEMICIDLSGEYIQQLTSASEAEQLPIHPILGDMFEVNIPGPVDGAFCLGNSFGYHNIETMTLFAKKIAAALKPGGRWVINTGMAAECILYHFRERDWMRTPEITVLLHNRYNPGESCLNTEFTFIHDGIEEVKEVKHWCFTLAEIKRILAAAGLETEAVYGNTEKELFYLGHREIYLVARKHK